jgi:hypothetical protein
MFDAAQEFIPSLPDGSAPLRVLFLSLALFVAVSVVGGVYWSSLRSGVARSIARRHALIGAAAAAVWLAVTGLLASRGALRFAAPPTMIVVFPIVIISAIVFAFSSVGRRLALSLPLVALVGFQSFRIGVELLMHRAYVEGLMPVQMSYAGRNFDIVTGITAAGLAIWFAMGHRSSGLLLAWNTLGAALLTNVLVIALLSAPTPLRVFTNEPSNVWVTRAPWVWLPTVFVWAAICGHALVYRRVWLESLASRKRPAPVIPTGVGLKSS